jgi:DNA-binding response OmpR family regulator
MMLRRPEAAGVAGPGGGGDPAVPYPERPGRSAIAPSTAADRAVRVLIVEDEPLIADYMSIVLSRTEVRVVGAARTGAEAVRIAEREPPDIALVDIGLGGGMDGWTVARQLRERFATRAVFITGQSLKEVAPRASALGAGCLHKPFRAGELVDAVAQARRS